MKQILIALVLLVFIAGCSEKKEEIPQPVRISPGPPMHYDVGDESLKNKLPEDMADGYLQFNKAPGLSYGLMMAHEKISPRYHERSDMLVYIHTGIARFYVADTSYYISMGDAVYIPRGAVYSVVNRHILPLEFFTVYSPPLDPNDVVYQEEL